MFFIACANDCGFVARIDASLDVGQARSLVGPGSDWYPDSYPCPKCGSLCVHSLRCDPKSRVTDLTPLQAFIAFSGGGLPEESECGASAVHRMLCGSRVKDADVQHIGGTHRCKISSITLEDGTTLHLGASAHGASVYRVTRPYSYTKEALGE